MNSSLIVAARNVANATGKNSSVTEQLNVYKPNGEERYTYMLTWYKGTALNARYFQSISELTAFAKSLCV